MKNVFERDPKLTNPSRIFNLNETGTLTVPGQSPRILAGKNVKQVSQAVSGERGVLVTSCFFVNAAGQSFPPMMIFPRVNLNPKMLKHAIPNTLGLVENLVG